MILWKGLSEYRNKLRKAPDKLRIKTKQDIERWRLGVVYQAMRDAPVDLGKLRQSINSEATNRGLGGKVSVNVPYAGIMEFGSGAGVVIPAGWEEVAAMFKGGDKRKVTIAAQPYLIPAVKSETEKLKARLRYNLKNSL